MNDKKIRKQNTLNPCRCCNGTGMEKAFQARKPKLTYQRDGWREVAEIAGHLVEIRDHYGRHHPLLDGEALAGSPTYASADAAKLAVERQLLELARVVVEILG